MTKKSRDRRVKLRKSKFTNYGLNYIGKSQDGTPIYYMKGIADMEERFLKEQEKNIKKISHAIMFGTLPKEENDEII